MVLLSLSTAESTSSLTGDGCFCGSKPWPGFMDVHALRGAPSGKHVISAGRNTNTARDVTVEAMLLLLVKVRARLFRQSRERSLDEEKTAQISLMLTCYTLLCTTLRGSDCRLQSSALQRAEYCTFTIGVNGTRLLFLRMSHNRGHTLQS